MHPFSSSDHRLVQTAVVGRPESDVPVYLPDNEKHYDWFVHQNTRKNFYCGTLLGGCGRPVIPKRYDDEIKVCHFAHDRNLGCSGVRGESAADHLFIGHAIRNWLDDQGLHLHRPDYISGENGPRGAVQIGFGGGARSSIYVQLERKNPVEWQRIRDRLSRSGPEPFWAFGPGTELAWDELQATGRALHFMCRTAQDRTREVRIGEQIAGRREVVWTTMESCQLTRDGIIVPGKAINVGDAPRKSAGDSRSRRESLTPRKHDYLVNAFREVLEDAAIRGEYRTWSELAKAVGCDPARLTEQERIDLLARVDRLGSGEGPSLALLLCQTQSGTRTPDSLLYELVQRRSPALKLSQSDWAAAWLGQCETVFEHFRTREPSQHGHTWPPRMADVEIQRIVPAVRAALERAARRAPGINWVQIRKDVRTEYPIHPYDQIEILVAVDDPTPDSEPPLSSMVTKDNGGHYPLWQQVMERLGREVRGSDPEMACGIDRLKLQNIWGRR